MPQPHERPGFPRDIPSCYNAFMVEILLSSTLQGREVTAISRQCELLILCARIGFNP
jgi:hypothetical protein